MLCGDVEINLGPKAISQQGFSVFHWNLNICAKFCQKIYKFDIICLSENYLDSSIPTNNGNLAVDGYNLVRSDHPSNIKRGGINITFASN